MKKSRIGSDYLPGTPKKEFTVENCNKSNLAFHETTFIFILAMSRSKQNDLV